MQRHQRDVFSWVFLIVVFVKIALMHSWFFSLVDFGEGLLGVLLGGFIYIYVYYIHIYICMF